MNIADVLDALKPHKGLFHKTEDGQIRHTTLKDINGEPCCPLAVISHDRGFTACNMFPSYMAKDLDLPLNEYSWVVRAADGLRSIANPYREMLENACL